MQSPYDVAIVGYGPTGATLASLLGQYGLTVAVFDREADIYDLPRAVHFDDEVMRIFQLVGIEDALLEKLRINPGMRFVDSTGKLLLDWPRPGGLSSQGWNSSYRFHQPDLERILRDSVHHLSNVDVYLSHTVDEVVLHPGHVALQAKAVLTGDLLTCHADYVIGCDGARSIMRTVIGAEMDDFGFREKWLVADVELTKPRPDLGDHSIQHCDPQRSATYVRGPGNRRRWEIALKDRHAHLDHTNPEEVWSLLASWISPEDADLERSAVYEFRSVVAQQWQRDRMFLAGDAAHQMPPFMGQGLCAGIRDVANLAWKLAACISGGAEQQLLETYASERRDHVRRYVELSIKLGLLINASKPEAALAAAFPQQDGSVKLESIAPPLGPGLGASDQNLSRHLSHQLILANGEKMDNAAGLKPVLLLSENSNQIDGGGFDGLILAGNEEPSVQIYLENLGCVAMIIRPDRYIYDTATTSDQIPDMIGQWTSLMTNNA